MDIEKNLAESGGKIEKSGRGLVAWLFSVTGWLLCAAMCLILTIELEKWPQAYDMFFPAVLLILFCNILLFLFVSGRWCNNNKALFWSVFRICVGEGLLLALFYLLGRFAIGA